MRQLHHIQTSLMIGRFARPLTLLAAILFSLNVQAEEPDSAPTLADAPSFRIQGFGTLGMARSNDNSVEFVRDLSQPSGLKDGWSAKIDSILGVQANYSLSNQTEAVAQLVSRYHSDGTFSPELTWAFLRHDFTPDFSLRAGRLGTEYYMLGDSRLIGYANIAVRPPVDFFGTLVFNSLDGIDATYSQPLGEGVLRGKVLAGYSPETTAIAEGVNWSLKGTLITGGYLDYQVGPWQLRASAIGSRFKHELPFDTLNAKFFSFLPPGSVPVPYLAAVPGMAVANTWAWYDSLSMVYDDGPLTVQLMGQKINFESPTYQDSKAAYALLAYRFGAIQPYIGYSTVKSNGAVIPASTTGNLAIDGLLDGLVTPAHLSQTHNDQTTYTLGVRWDFARNMALKAQVDVLDGDTSSIYLFRGTPPKTWDGSMTVYSLALDFVF